MVNVRVMLILFLTIFGPENGFIVILKFGLRYDAVAIFAVFDPVYAGCLYRSFGGHAGPSDAELS